MGLVVAVQPILMLIIRFAVFRESPILLKSQKAEKQERLKNYSKKRKANQIQKTYFIL